jgi:type VI secretion system secreted protein VgrG
MLGTAKTPAFLFLCPAVAIATIIVKELKGKDLLCAPYFFDILFDSTDPYIVPSALIGQKATICLYRNEIYFPYSGIISEFTFVKTSTDYTTYRAVVRPRLWLLTLTTQSRVFQRMTIPEIVKNVLNDAGLDQYYETRLDVSAYPQREYVVQYQETDYNFILRLMQTSGIWFQFKERPVLVGEIGEIADGEKMIISDEPSVFESLYTDPVIKYRTRSDMVQNFDHKEFVNIYELQSKRNIISQKVIVKSYNYRTPEIQILSEKLVPGGDMGLVYEYGGGFKDITQAEKYASIIAHRIAITKHEFLGKGNCSGMRAGCRFTLEEHDIAEMNQLYVVSEVSHIGIIDKNGFNRFVLSYHNEFKCFLSDNSRYYRPQFTANKTIMPDFMTARIEGCGSEYSTLDEQGRYKVRMPFDISDSPVSQASKYIRMLQEYSGSQYGIHFPTHENAEIIISHVNGDPDKPIGIRVIPDFNTISPVTNSNQRQSVIRTCGQNEMIMDDTSGKQHFSLSTPYDMNMNAANNQSISITKDRKLTISGNETKEVAIDQSLSVNGNRSIDITGNKEESITGNSVTELVGDGKEMVSGNKNVEVSGDQSETFSLSRKVEVQGDINETIEANHVVEVTGTSTMDISGNLSIEAGENFSTIATAAITIMGNSVTLKGTKELALQAGLGVVSLSSSDGIVINAPVLAMTGGKMDVKAKTNCNATGLLLMLN